MVERRTFIGLLVAAAAGVQLKAPVVGIRPRRETVRLLTHPDREFVVDELVILSDKFPGFPGAPAVPGADEWLGAWQGHGHVGLTTPLPRLNPWLERVDRREEFAIAARLGGSEYRGRVRPTGSSLLTGGRFHVQFQGVGPLTRVVI